MTEKQSDHVEELSIKFLNEFYEKYSRGAQEHKGFLKDLPVQQLVQEIRHEILDLWAYIGTLEEKLNDTNN